MQTMNAAEIIQEFNRLPEEEKGKVVEFLRHLPNAETQAAMNEPSEGLPRFDSVEDLFSELES
jgi:predicted metallopeptidase